MPRKKFIFLGCGSVVKATIYFLKGFFEFDCKNVYIIDEIDMRSVPCLQEILKNGANFMKLRLEDDDYQLLFKLLKVKCLDILLSILQQISTVSD